MLASSKWTCTNERTTSKWGRFVACCVEYIICIKCFVHCGLLFYRIRDIEWTNKTAFLPWPSGVLCHTNLLPRPRILSQLRYCSLRKMQILSSNVEPPQNVATNGINNILECNCKGEGVCTWYDLKVRKIAAVSLLKAAHIFHCDILADTTLSMKLAGILEM